MGPRTRQSNSADGARSKHGAFARREYDLLASEVTDGGPANAGVSGSKVGHGALANREGTETEEEGDETLQRTLPTRETDGEETEARGPPKQSRARLTRAAPKGRKGRGNPLTQQSAPTAHSRDTRGGG